MTRSGEMPNFNQDQCTGCQLCVSVCAHNGFVIKGDLIMLNEEADCVACKDCELVCPSGALSFPFEIVEET